MLSKFGITKFEKIVYSLILVFIVIVTVMHFYFPDALWAAVQEDALFENLTIVFLFGCVIICAINIKQLMVLKKNKGVFTYFFLILMLVFVIGEELSWGQRIFNINTGNYFMEHNTQSETNIHNLQIGDVRVNKLFFTQLSAAFLAIYFLFSRLICQKVRFFDKLRKNFYFPLPKLHHTIFFYFAFLSVYAFHYSRNNEVMELIFPVIFMLIFLNPYKLDFKKE